MSQRLLLCIWCFLSVENGLIPKECDGVWLHGEVGCVQEHDYLGKMWMKSSNNPPNVFCRAFYRQNKRS